MERLKDLKLPEIEGWDTHHFFFVGFGSGEIVGFVFANEGKRNSFGGEVCFEWGNCVLRSIIWTKGNIGILNCLVVDWATYLNFVIVGL